LTKLRERFASADDEFYHVGRGVAFHIAPSNVAVNYAYSLAAGLICGNANIVRVPSKAFPQVNIINNAIKKVLGSFSGLENYICLIKYNRDRNINDMLSSICDIRIIWGGDATISELRKSPLPPRATEITFADRYSLAVIDLDYYMESDYKDRIASDFYNDTYLTDQNACTSPRVVVWVGAHKDDAKKLFWDKLHAIAAKKYDLKPIMSVDKLSQSYMAASEYKGNHVIPSDDNILTRIRVDSLSHSLMDYRGNCGYFYEYDCSDIMELRDFCNDTHCQTIGVIGDAAAIRPLIESGIKGVDRIVQVGHTMDFDLIWDGYNLVERMTRTVNSK
jgi:hypothetical protein